MPLISLYFANLASERGPVPVRDGGLGAFLLVGALLVKLATVVVVVGTLGDLALIVAVAGVVACWRGRGVQTVRVRDRLPGVHGAAAGGPLRGDRLAAPVDGQQGGLRVLERDGRAGSLTEGNMMTLPGGVQMFVAEACSGMRQLTGFLALTSAVAYLSGRPAWYRAAVVGSAVPIAMTANVARVTLTGYIMYSSTRTSPRGLSTPSKGS